MVAGAYPPAFPLKHQLKDLRLALELGAAAGQPLPVAAAARQLYEQVRERAVAWMSWVPGAQLGRMRAVWGRARASGHRRAAAAPCLQRDSRSQRMVAWCLRVATLHRFKFASAIVVSSASGIERESQCRRAPRLAAESIFPQALCLCPTPADEFCNRHAAVGICSRALLVA